METSVGKSALAWSACACGVLAFAVGATGSGFASGVTIITHGFNGNVTDQLIPMADEMPGYPTFPGAIFSGYEISITDIGSGQYGADAT